jgi:hypothetical protein
MSLEESLARLEEKSTALKKLLDTASSAIDRSESALYLSAFKREFKWKIPNTPDILFWGIRNDKFRLHLWAKGVPARPFIECTSELRLKYVHHLPDFIDALVKAQSV